ncbi:MAG: alpha-galactosidase [Planctomycetia bacterium]|nr:alpha-galactosidase [Planctomycetia bacterium]
MNPRAHFNPRLSFILIIIVATNNVFVSNNIQANDIATNSKIQRETAFKTNIEFEKRGIIFPEEPIQFQYNNIECRTFSCDQILSTEERQEVVSENVVEGDSFPRQTIFKTIVEKTDATTGLKITSETTTYSDFPEIIEWVAWFENVSEVKTPNLRNILAADVILQTGGSPSLWHGMGENNDPQQNYSSQTDILEISEPLHFSPREAYPSFYAFPYFRLNGQERSFTIAIGWPGEWSATFYAEPNGDVHFLAGQKKTDLYLKPGEKIRTPRITVFSYLPETDAINLWRRWFRAYIMPRQNGKVLEAKLILDAHCGGELYKDITETQQIDAIRKMRALGWPCDGLWIDAGWYLRQNSPKTSIGYWFLTGDWTPDPERFPRGMKPIADELGKESFLTLWYEPERIHREASTFIDYQKYIVPNCEIIESYRMDMTSPETVQFLSNLIGQSIQSNGVGFYRQDSNGAGPLPFLEHLEKTDSRFIDRKGMAENLYVQGYLTFWNNLKTMNPGLLIDSCASGGRRNDLDSLRMGAVPLHYTDVGYFDFINKQRYHDMLDQWFIYYKNIDAHDWDGEKREYDFYKATVDLAPFTTLRPYLFEHNSATNRRYVERFLQIRDLLVGSNYYLLEGGFRSDSWTVSQYHASNLNAGCLRVIRNEESPNQSLKIYLKEINPNSRYCFKNLDSGQIENISGRDLIREGFSISMPPRSGQLVRYDVLP